MLCKTVNIKFKAWDKINREWIDLHFLRLDGTGKIMTVMDLDGEIYGMNQVEILYFLDEVYSCAEEKNIAFRLAREENNRLERDENRWRWIVNQHSRNFLL